MSRVVYLITIFIILSSCNKGKLDPFDRASGASKDEIRYKLVRNHQAEDAKLKLSEESSNYSPIPQISKMIVVPKAPKIGGDKLISFSVTDEVPLKDVLIEIGRVADIDIDLDPSISGGVIINAVDKPLKEVIDRIAILGKLRYSYEKGVLYFKRDTPYLHNYFVDYLADGSLWADVEENITALLNSQQSSRSSDDENGKSIAASSFTSNKSAGIISVFASSTDHELVQKYLDAVEKTSSAQVLIEAKVVEVTLSDQYKTGIEWSWLSGRELSRATVGEDGEESSINITRRNLSIDGGFDTSSAANMVFTGLMGGNLDLSVSALEEFGTTKTLSSPRIHAMNNQAASLNFADKLVYFEIDATQTSNTANSDNVVQTFTSEIKEEDVGVQLEIIPSINLKKREVVMKIKPTLSVKSNDVVDPASPPGIENLVPVIQSRELETVAKVESGNVIVIGGLMKEEQTNKDTGIPYLKDIPILGWLFKSSSKVSTVTETVIFIKATIVDSATPANDVDKEMQEMFDSNRRRFFE